MNFEIHDELCSGCATCRLVCALANFQEINPAKAALAIIGHFPAPGTYEIKFCDQCGACAEVCPVDAIEERSGVFFINGDTCTGCGACVEECPHGVLMAAPDSDIPIKCTACGECAAVCPRDAIVNTSLHQSEEQ
jgi:Fe-S-cluster-containing hydrogenase component 2